MRLDDLLDAMRVVRRTGDGRLDPQFAAEVDGVLRHAQERREHSPDVTVVGVFGATGSGKSSLVNALVGEQVARTHVRRPTTSEPLAATWTPDGAVDLLDWLGVRERVVLDRPLDPRATDLVLLDLPDFDSVEAGNRATAQRLAGQVDALVWVVDPQKYADDVLHAQFIAPHARHAEVTLIVLNQIDRLAADDVRAVTRSLAAIVERDGIPNARVLPVSAASGQGVPELRTALGDLVAARSARDRRLAADLATLAGRVPSAGRARSAAPTGALVDDVAVAAGVEVVSAAVAGSYRKRAAQATGWPLLSWIPRLRADPLRRLGLRPVRRDRDPEVHRTSLPEMSSASRARMSLAVRGYAEAASDGLAETWRAGIREAATRGIDELPDELDLAIARTPLPARGLWWWPVFAVLQWLVLLAGIGGVGWLLAAALFPRFGLPEVEVIEVEGWAVPTLLIAGAVLGGILLALLGALLGGLTARARRRSARRRLVRGVGPTVQRLVVEPVAAELERAREYESARRGAA